VRMGIFVHLPQPVLRLSRGSRNVANSSKFGCANRY
jgi:hypothetical protein